MTTKSGLIIIADYSQSHSFTLHELCEICHIPIDFINELIAYDIIHPSGANPDEWVFDVQHLQRIRKALRLQRDLEVNLAGIAVVLELLDELEKLRAEKKVFEKHYFIQR